MENNETLKNRRIAGKAGKRRVKGKSPMTWLCLLLLLPSILLWGCGKEENVTTSVKEAREDKIEIGMSFDSFVIERWERDRDVFVSTAKDMGATVNVQNANGDIKKQIEQINYFIEKGVDVIVIICIDSDSLKDVVKKAKDAGIKIIAYDRLVTNSNVDLYISFDNEMVGTLMADALVESGVSKVLMLGGSPTDSNVPLVEGGFKTVCDEKEVEIVDSMHCDGWRAELAAEYLYAHEELLESVDAIMCGNDNLAGQVIHLLAEKRLAGSIAVVGQDADLEACQRIVEGTQTATVYKPVEKLAKRAAECAIALATGQQIEGDDITTINDGSYDVLYIGLEPVAVNEENMNEAIIDSGFHLKEDVYLFAPDKMP